MRGFLIVSDAPLPVWLLCAPFLSPRHRHSAVLSLTVSVKSTFSSLFHQVLKLLNVFKCFPLFPSLLLCLLNFLLSFPPLLGSRATVFWDHMTISQSRPPPLPMFSSPHGVASPAQFRPALRMPPTLPRPPQWTTSSTASQVNPGVKGPKRNRKWDSDTCTWPSLAETCHLLRTNRRWRPVPLSCSVPFLLGLKTQWQTCQSQSC